MLGDICAAGVVLAVLLGRACGNTQLVWVDSTGRTFSSTPELWEHARGSAENTEMTKGNRMVEMLHIASFDFKSVAGLDKDRRASFLLEFVDECRRYRYHVICIQNITRYVFEVLSEMLQEDCTARYMAVESIGDRLVCTGGEVECTDYATFFDSSLIVCTSSMISTMHNRYTYEGMQSFFETNEEYMFGIKMEEEGLSNETALLTCFSTLKTNVRFKVANFVFNGPPRKLPLIQMIVDLNFYIGLDSNPASHKFIAGSFNAPMEELRKEFFLRNFLNSGCIPGRDYNFFYMGRNDPRRITTEITGGFYACDAFKGPFEGFYPADSTCCVFCTEEIRHFALLVERASPMRINSPTRFQGVQMQSCVGCYIVPNCYDNDGHSLIVRSSGKSSHLWRKRTMNDISKNITKFYSNLRACHDEKPEVLSEPRAELENQPSCVIS